MMSSLFCLLLLLSLHACNARPLGLSDKQVLLSGKDVRSSTAEEIKEQEKFWAKMDESSIHESRREANAMPLQRISKAPEIKEEDDKGIRVKETSFRAFQETGGETGKRQARSTLQSLTHDAEETLNSKENDIPEDVVVMDYAQPQRKPPIHNR